jgi:hypothetical protein
MLGFRMASIPLSLSFLTMVLAGCVADPAPALADDGHHHGMSMRPTFTMEGTSCEEGGFVAAYPMRDGAKLAGVWELADIRPEIGNPMRDGNGAPLNGPADGNWHMGYQCASVDAMGAKSKDFIFGWVGDMVKAPSWDPGGADLHYLVSGIGFQNGTIADAIRASTSAAITHAYEPTGVTWYIPRDTPRSAAFVIFSDSEKGIYESYSELYKYRDLGTRTVRLWWQVPADGTDSPLGHGHNDDAMEAKEGGTWHPVYWDITTTGGPQYVTPPVDSVEAGCHVGNADHGNPVGACQPTLTDVYEHKSLTFGTGHVIEDVTLTELWSH